LAVEFSSEQRSVAVVENGRVLGEAFESGGRASIAIVEKALVASKIEPEAIECIAIGTGPGSYTGIRGAISLAQGWQLAREIKLLGISSVECLAAQAQREKVFGKIAVVVDAQREEFYLATYEVSEKECRLVDPLRIVPAAQVKALGEQGTVLIGPDSTMQSNPRLVFPQAAVLGQIASTRNDFVPGEKLEPIYLREISFKKLTPVVVR
jgi:tRNA threonylcarbamoyladenosine biosynthesis protein TsaB